MATKISTVPAIEKKALAESNKSEGMRMLFDAGYTVAKARTVFNAPYGFVYGVAKRHGVVEQAAQRRAPRQVTAAVAKKASATKPSTAARVQASRAPKSTAKTAKPATKPGRPSAARRAANRAPRAVAAPAKTSAASKRAAAANR